MECSADFCSATLVDSFLEVFNFLADFLSNCYVRIESGVLKFPTIIAEFSTSLNLVFFFFLLHDFGALFPGAYVSVIVDSFSRVDPLAILSPSSSLITSLLPDASAAAPTLF